MPKRKAVTRPTADLPGPRSSDRETLLQWRARYIREICRPVSRNPFKNAWDFLSRAVWTKDEATGRIRKFPTWEEVEDYEPPTMAQALEYGRGSRPAAELEERKGSRPPVNRWEYLRFLTEEVEKHRIVGIDKSRRMLITWWGVARWLYYLLTQDNEASWIASDKLEKSAHLLGEDRMMFIYRHIPPVDKLKAEELARAGYDPEPFLEPVWPDKPDVVLGRQNGRGYESISCPRTGSYVQAVARGETQMQQYTATRVWCDEFSRWEWAAESWAALVPTIQGGGRIEFVGTPELGAYMYDLCYGGGAGDR